jgi:hypothetical protein
MSAAGLTAAALTTRFDKEFWSPASKKLVLAALMQLDCQSCQLGPVLHKPKHNRWNHILTTKYLH